MTFRPRLGDALLGAFAVLLVMAIMHRAESYADTRADAKTPVVHHRPAKVPQWPHRVA
jgi:hypothetical protein